MCMINNKGMILIDSLVGLITIVVIVSIVFSLVELVNAIETIQMDPDMDGYWLNLSHFLVYFPWPEPIVDIAY